LQRVAAIVAYDEIGRRHRGALLSGLASVIPAFPYDQGPDDTISSPAYAEDPRRQSNSTGRNNSCRSTNVAMRSPVELGPCARPLTNRVWRETISVRVKKFQAVGASDLRSRLVISKRRRDVRHS
jgi:hypothetical protein